MTMKEHVSAIGEAFINGLRVILGEKLAAAYIFGAAAFPDDVPTGDFDFHVILSDALTDDEKTLLYALHDALARDFPPLGGEGDGYYILLQDARRATPPCSQMWACVIDEAWALHREHLRAGRVIVLHGPDPTEIYLPATRQEIAQALAWELQYVVDSLSQYPDYGILQLCRLLYSRETGNVVVSKAQAAIWALEALPEWTRPITLAKTTYPQQATPEGRQYLLNEAAAFLKFARPHLERITESI